MQKNEFGPLLYGQHLRRGCPVASAADPARRRKIIQRESKSLVQGDDAGCRLVRQDDRPRMPGQTFRRAYLIVPGEAARAVGGEFHIIGWISIDKITRFKRQTFQIAISEPPTTR